MKTIIASLLLVTWLSNSATAQTKKHNHKGMAGCPAATCTDHSYDQAYNASADTREAMELPTKNCPAATCTDHSYDYAYTAPQNNRTARAPRRIVETPKSALPADTWVRMRGNEQSYSMNEYTYYGRGTTGIARPTAYEGDDAPTYDGAAKNAYRNMRANNDSEPLPANNGR